MVGVPQHLCMKAMCRTADGHKKKLYAQQHLTFPVIICLPKDDMLLLRTFAPWLLLALLGRQVSLSSASGALNKTRGADKSAVPAPGRAQRSGGKGAATGRGKFSLKDKMQCTWGARQAGDEVRLSVDCESPEARVKGGVTDLRCEYAAKPQSCPGYRSDPKGFWKQVARALKRLQGKVCKDERALAKAGMCKRAPRDAHFKLDAASSVSSAQSGEPEVPPPLPPRATSAGAPACAGRADRRKTAEEYCSSSWASVCSFFLSMLQNDDC
ncbi:fibroblast growth factor-binding protein 1-like [Xiphias gladius]|uniref:fibroblast growth factor-binding protein 1-like n=1 Tax=Xiphias gladius TaxID=8245 RepID=UPI001A98769E|nr:fibroblast growth factor-binding protein 1-like [Xiphias gladius]